MLDTGDAMTDMNECIARSFVDARKMGVSVTDYPGTPPIDFAEAYAIQERAITLFGNGISGWKVGRVNPPHDTILGCTRLAGPIFDCNTHVANGAAITMPVFDGGFAAVEAELLFRIDSLPQQAPAALTDDAIMAHVGAVHVGVEIASSPYARINLDGPLVTASDFGNNGGLVVGEELPDWRTRDLAAVTAAVVIDAVEIGRADMRDLPGGPIESVRFLLGHVAARPSPMRLPFWVSAGAISGVHAIAIGSHAIASFDNAQAIPCRIVAVPAQG